MNDLTANNSIEGKNSFPSRKQLWIYAFAAPAIVAPVWCWTMSHWAIGTVSGVILLLLLFVSSLTDLSRRKIFNWTTYCAIVWALGLNATSELGFDWQLGAVGLKQSICGLLGCFVVMLFVYSLARGGAGDVKLAAAIGALIGFEQGILTIAASYVIAGATVLLWSIWQRGPLSLLVAMGRLIGSMLLPLWIERPNQTDKLLLNKPIPLAQFFAVGTLVVIGGLL